MIGQYIGAAKLAINSAFYDDKVGGDALKQFKTIGKLFKGNSNKRRKIIAPSEFNRLADEVPSHLKPILQIGYHNGMREGKVLQLRLGMVFLKDRIIKLLKEITEDNEDREILISEDLHEILSSLQRGIQGDLNVFTRRGKAIKDIRTGLTMACQKAGIAYGRFKEDGFIFHDLRRTFYIEARRAGIPDSTIKEITGHSRNQVTDGYDDVSMNDRKKELKD